MLREGIYASSRWHRCSPSSERRQPHPLRAFPRLGSSSISSASCLCLLNHLITFRAPEEQAAAGATHFNACSSVGPRLWEQPPAHTRPVLSEALYRWQLLPPFGAQTLTLSVSFIIEKLTCTCLALWWYLLFTAQRARPAPAVYVEPQRIGASIPAPLWMRGVPGLVKAQLPSKPAWTLGCTQSAIGLPLCPSTLSYLCGWTSMLGTCSICAADSGKAHFFSHTVLRLN